MLTREEARGLINDLFEEEALVLGGLVAIHRVDEKLVWRLVQSLDVIHDKTLSRIGHEPDGGAASARKQRHLRPHPAIEDFLLKLRRV